MMKQAEEHTQKTEENRHVPETCTEKVEKSTDDGWKPWPPENWNDIQEGEFQVTIVTEKPFIPWYGTHKRGCIVLEGGTPLNKLKWWRQC